MGIRQPEYNKGSLNPALTSTLNLKLDYPVFCLKHPVKGYTLSDCDKKLIKRASQPAPNVRC